MRTGANEVDGGVLDLVNQEEIPTYVTFSMVGPFALEGVIQPLRAQWRVVGDQEQHGLLEVVHVVPTRAS